MKITAVLNNSLRLLTIGLFSMPVVTEVLFVRGAEYVDSLGGDMQGPAMVVLPAGSFVTGDLKSNNELGKVVFEHSFAISKTEVTRGMYRKYLVDNKSVDLLSFGSSTVDDNKPVNGLTWYEAESFTVWLSRKTGHNYRLPTASEWEYAARAGSNSTYSWGNDVGENKANCRGCKADKWNGEVMNVASFPANDWGIFDMHGNVWEWAKDCLDSNSAPPANGAAKLFGNCAIRELRGGSAESDAWSIRISARAYGQQDMRSKDVGLRVVMDNPEPTD